MRRQRLLCGGPVPYLHFKVRTRGGNQCQKNTLSKMCCANLRRGARSMPDGFDIAISPTPMLVSKPGKNFQSVNVDLGRRHIVVGGRMRGKNSGQGRASIRKAMSAGRASSIVMCAKFPGFTTL